MHLRYVLTEELKPWIYKPITNNTDPINNDDPEPHSKSYIAEGTKMPKQKLAQNKPK
jgi:hypothetical protein